MDGFILATYMTYVNILKKKVKYSNLRILVVDRFV